MSIPLKFIDLLSNNVDILLFPSHPPQTPWSTLHLFLMLISLYQSMMGCKTIMDNKVVYKGCNNLKVCRVIQPKMDMNTIGNGTTVLNWYYPDNITILEPKLVQISTESIHPFDRYFLLSFHCFFIHLLLLSTIFNLLQPRPYYISKHTVLLHTVDPAPLDSPQFATRSRWSVPV